MKPENLFKILLILLPLILMFSSVFFLKPEKEFVIANFKNIFCDDIIKEGMKIENINGFEIKSEEDFKLIKNKIKPNESFFIVSDGKIIKCKPENESVFDIKVVEKPYFYSSINLERIVINNTEKNRKILDTLGYKYYILDENQIILPFDQRLIELLSSDKDLRFYLEIDLERENDTVRFLDKTLNISDLYEIYDEVIISEKNVTAIKYLFNQEFIKDFDLKIRYFYPLSISSVNLTFIINETASKKLKHYLESVPLRLIQLEKFYDAKLTIKTKNVTVLSYYLPYQTYENHISISLINVENPKKIKELIAIQLFNPIEISEEKTIRIFSIEYFILVFSILFLIIFSLKTKNFSFIYFIPLMISSLIFPIIFPLTLLIFTIIKTVIFRKVDYENLFFLLLSLIILNFSMKTFVSIFTIFLTIFFFSIFDFFYNYFKKYEIITLFIFTFSALITFFFNPLISFSLFFPILSKIFEKRFLSV